MNNRIRRIVRSAHTIACVAVLVILASCQNPASDDGQNPSGTVTITLASAGGAARSIMPSTPSFSRYVLTLQRGETTQTPDADGLAADGVTVQLEPGTWSVTVDAFQSLDHDGNAETPTQEYKAATATASLTVEAGGSNSVAVQLDPVDDASQGVFAWDITLPEGVDSATMSLGTVSALTGLDLTQEANRSGSAEAPSGVYNLTILLSKDGLSTSLIEKVYIYGGLQTTAALDLSDLVFGDEVLIAGTLTVTGSDGPESGYAVNAYATEADANSESSPIGTVVSATVGTSWEFLLGIPTSDYNALGVGTVSGKTVYLRATHPDDLTDSSFKITENGVVTVDDLPANGAAGKSVSLSVISTIYTVSYDANGGSVSPDSTTANEESSITLPTPTRNGHTFNGWYTASSEGTKIDDAGASYILTANITLYAQWTDIRVTLTPGSAVDVAADDTSASVAFTGATGLSLSATDFEVSSGGIISNVDVASDTATVTASFAANTSATLTETYTVSIASTSGVIKGDATVNVTQAVKTFESGITVLPPAIPGDAVIDLTGPEPELTWLNGTITASVDNYQEFTGSGSGSYSEVFTGSYSGAAWPVQEDGRRKSPTIGHNRTTVTRYNFTSTSANAYLVIQLQVSSESTYDFAFVGNLDSTASMSSYYDRISGSTSKTITISVPTAGSHFVEIGYGKDNIISSGSDCAWFTIEQYELSTGEISWYMDGVQIAGQTSATLAANARNYSLGTHGLTVIATKGDGQSYSKTVNFTIVEE